MLHAEIQVHQYVSQGKPHANVVAFYAWFEDRDNVYITLELCHRGDLMDFVTKRKRLTEPEAQFYQQQLLHGLAFLHGKNVMHRDLKLGNLFIDQHMNLKIGDFGLAVQLMYDGEQKTEIAGTPNYIAPEILSGRRYSFEIDIWSFGVILYTLLVGKPPFQTTDVKLTYRKIKANSYTFPDRVIGRDARDLITRILHPDPRRRPALATIYRHQFFQKGGIPRSIPSSALYSVPRFSESDYMLPPPPGRALVSEGVPPLANEARAKAVTPPVPAKPTVSARPRTHLSGGACNTDALAPAVWVSKWVDYSSKYGLGYLLCDGHYGVAFNDSTQIVLHPDQCHVEYMERRRIGGGGSGHDNTTAFELTKLAQPSWTECRNCKSQRIGDLRNYDETKSCNCPGKKVKLLEHFRNYLQKDQPAAAGAGLPLRGMVFVKKWQRTRHAFIFRLSNQTIQVHFHDHTEIILSSNARILTYMGKTGVRSTYQLVSIPPQQDLIKRLKYTKEILHQLITKGQPAATSEPVLIALASVPQLDGGDGREHELAVEEGKPQAYIDPADACVAAQVQLAGATAVLIEGLPLSLAECNGSYLRDTRHEGWPRFLNAQGKHLYYCKPRRRWFVNKRLTPDRDGGLACIDAEDGRLPTGVQEWHVYDSAGWKAFRLLVSLCTDSAETSQVGSQLAQEAEGGVPGLEPEAEQEPQAEPEPKADMQLESTLTKIQMVTAVGQEEEVVTPDELARRALLERLLEMGYLPAQCEAALATAHGSGKAKLGAAVEMLLAAEAYEQSEPEPEPEPQELSLAHAVSEGVPTNASPPASAPTTPEKDEQDSQLARLQEMGYSQASCESALAKSPGSGRAKLNAAVSVLLSGE
jgi:polo-like kinase 1